MTIRWYHWAFNWISYWQGGPIRSLKVSFAFSTHQMILRNTSLIHGTRDFKKGHFDCHLLIFASIQQNFTNCFSVRCSTVSTNGCLIIPPPSPDYTPHPPLICHCHFSFFWQGVPIRWYHRYIMATIYSGVLHQFYSYHIFTRRFWAVPWRK